MPCKYGEHRASPLPMLMLGQPASVLYIPALQLSHAVLTPSRALCVPAAQFVQVEAAAVGEYLPAPHSVQL
jgi:hypothetical protein